MDKDISQHIDYYLKSFPLYKDVKIDSTNISFFLSLFKSNLYSQLDIYCTSCKKETTFKIQNPTMGGFTPGDSLPSVEKKIMDLNGFHNLLFECTRDHKQYSFQFHINYKEKTVQKIGQYPSLADLQLHDINKYRKLLNKEYSEFSKAIGLNANGIGIGSFVYLRRIFENLIYDTYNQSSLEIEGFSNLRMNDKVKELKSLLPEIIFEIPQLYSILSKGIHELDEDKCKEIFPQLKTAIELILEEKLAAVEKEKKISALRSSISKTATELSQEHNLED